MKNLFFPVFRLMFLLAGLFTIVSCGRESPQKVLEVFVLNPVPSGLEVLEYENLLGVAGSVRVFKLRISEEASKAIMDKRGGALTYLSAKARYAAKKTLEKHGIANVDDLKDFVAIEYEVDGHTVRVFLKERVAYGIISR